MKAVIRKDIWENDEIPSLMKGWPENLSELIESTGVENFYFNYRMLTEEYNGFNMVVWLPDEDFVDLANSVDWDFVGLDANGVARRWISD